MDEGRVLWVGRVRTKDAPLRASLPVGAELRVAAHGKQALAVAAAWRADVVVLDAVSLRTGGGRTLAALRAALPHAAIGWVRPGPLPSCSDPADAVFVPPVAAADLFAFVAEALAPPLPPTIGAGPFLLNTTHRTLTAFGAQRQLSPKLTKLSALFLSRPGETLPRALLIQQVWHTAYMGDTRTLDVHIRWFREALQDTARHPRYLKTVRGVGYRLDVPPPVLA